ncbi:MAG: hypothetical protein AAB500_02355 [Patescibacteria group bacterium]
MKNLAEIKKENMWRAVMSQIYKAKKEILATMDIAEELKNPLPKKYFSLLYKKHKEGIKIKRVIFGSTKQYKHLLKEAVDKNLFFIGKHTKSTNYKRMILIDRSKLFFSRGHGGKKKFYFTTDEIYLKEYLDYFNEI